MRLSILLLAILALPAVAQPTPEVEALERAARLDQQTADAWVRVGRAAQSSDDSAAEFAFMRAHQIDAGNSEALAGLASLAFEQAKATQDAVVRAKRFTKAEIWYRELLRVDPARKTAHYSLGVIEWEHFYPAFARKRASLAVNPKAAGPLADAGARAELRRFFASSIERAIAPLKTALVIDPDYIEAMLQLNLLYRVKADVEDSLEESQYDISCSTAHLRLARGHR